MEEQEPPDEGEASRKVEEEISRTLAKGIIEPRARYLVLIQGGASAKQAPRNEPTAIATIRKLPLEQRRRARLLAKRLLDEKYPAKASPEETK